MPLLALENYQKKYPELKDLLPKFDSYLEDQLAKAQSEGELELDIVPARVAKDLGIREALALALLMIADDARVIDPVYQVYCPTTDNFLKEYRTLKEIPKRLDCPFHDPPVTHTSGEYLVDLVFRFAPQVLEEKKSIAVHT